MFQNGDWIVESTETKKDTSNKENVHKEKNKKRKLEIKTGTQNKKQKVIESSTAIKDKLKDIKKKNDTIIASNVNKKIVLKEKVKKTEINPQTEKTTKKKEKPTNLVEYSDNKEDKNSNINKKMTKNIKQNESKLKIVFESNAKIEKNEKKVEMRGKNGSKVEMVEKNGSKVEMVGKNGSKVEKVEKPSLVVKKVKNYQKQTSNEKADSPQKKVYYSTTPKKVRKSSSSTITIITKIITINQNHEISRDDGRHIERFGDWHDL